MNKNPRYSVREQTAEIRRNNFNEVSLGFDQETMIQEANRCLDCKHAPCKNGCPVGVNIPEFITALKNNDPLKANEIIRETSSLPAICGRVCPQEIQCEKFCVRQKSGGAVAIGSLERYAADFALALDTPVVKPITQTSAKVAIIGSGPAGLACAGELANNGIQADVYEAFHKEGGVLVYGIPEFRLPKALVSKEIDKLKELGVNFILNTVIGKTIFIDELLSDYDAVFIGSGAGLPVFMNIDGENLNGVYSANEYLTRVNLMGAYKKNSPTPITVGNKVVVVGAGNVAMDAARTAIRLGAKEVYIVYRRSKQEMPARQEEIHHAEQEGVILKLLTNPIEIKGENFVTGVECIEMELGEPDISGRRTPIEKVDSNFTIECDQVIMSIGTSPNPLIKNSTEGLITAGKGTIVVDEKNMTSIEDVYAGGDAVTGAATVILAMGAGRASAKEIIAKLLTCGKISL